MTIASFVILCLFPAFIISEACTMEENVDYSGHDLNLDTGRNVDRKENAVDCRELCNSNPQCRYFTWKKHSKECWLKTSNIGRHSQSGSISGTACHQACTMEENADYSGYDLNLDTGRNVDRKETAEDCRELCKSNPQCRYFTWKKQSKECWLKTSDKGRHRQRGSISGTACRPQACNMEKNVDYYGHDLNPYTGRNEDRRETAEDCRKLCRSNPDCNYFTWKKQSEECWLKTSNKGSIYELGSISGTVCW